MDEFTQPHFMTALKLVGEKIARSHHSLIENLIIRVSYAVRELKIGDDNKERLMRAQVAVIDKDLANDVIKHVGTYNYRDTKSLQKAASKACGALEEWGVCLVKIELPGHSARYE